MNSKTLQFLALAFIMLLSINAKAQSYEFTETLNNTGIEATGWSEATYIGDNGNEWTLDVKFEPKGRINGSPAAYMQKENFGITSGTITGGISAFSVTCAETWGTGLERKVELYINDELVGEITHTSPGLFEFTVTDLAVTGDFTMKLKNASPEVADSQLSISFDNIKWNSADYKSPDADLAEILINEVTMPDFDAATITYTHTLPVGTTTIPVVSVVKSNANSTVVITQPLSVDGFATIVVTAEDTETIKTYTVNFEVATSNDATLSELKVDNVAIENFDPAILVYEYTVAAGTVDVPVVTATANYVGSDVVITQATSLSETTLVVVTAEDDTEITYSVSFVIEQSGGDNDATLTDLQVNEMTIPDFVYSTTNYDYVLPNGTREIPAVTATVSGTGATTTITQATSVDGIATVVVKSVDLTELTYTINFSVALSTDATLSDLQINDVTLADFDPATLTYNYLLADDVRDVSVITATANEANAVVEITQPTALLGSGRVKVTAEDGTVKKYDINFTFDFDYTETFSNVTTIGSWLNDYAYTGDNDFDWTINSGKALASGYVNKTLGFYANGVDQTVLTSGTISGGISAFSVSCKNRWDVVDRTLELYINGELAGSITEGSVDKVYEFTVLDLDIKGDFTMSIKNASGVKATCAYDDVKWISNPNDDATLSDIQVDQSSIADFLSTTMVYNVEVPFGTDVVPTITATATDNNADVTVIPAEALPGTTTINVLAEDGVATKSYTVVFSIATSNINITKDQLQVYPSPFTSHLDIKYNGEKQISDVNVYSISGQKIKVNQNQMNDGVSRINLNSLQTGMYLISIKFNDGSTEVFKRIKL